MDLKISEKEERLQAEGLVQVYVNDIFDVYPTISTDNFIEDLELLTEDVECFKQEALFASLQQLGSDPLLPSQGVRWAQAMLGEVQSDVLLNDIKNAVQGVSTSCAVVFTSAQGSDGNSYLVYDIKVVL